MIGSARLRAEVPPHSNFRPNGISHQGSTLEVDGEWPKLPPREGELGEGAPTWSLELTNGAAVRHDPLEPGRYLATCVFKIDDDRIAFRDDNAAVVYWLDRLGDLEIEGIGADVDLDLLIVSSLEISGIEQGEPYSAAFDVEFKVEGPGNLGVRAYLDGGIARSTLKGGRGRAEVRAALAEILATN